MSQAERSSDRQFFGHPIGLSTLFFTEMWERFSYYGMRGFLILFMAAPLAAGGMGLDSATAAAIYGTYTAMVYLLCVPGGWLADRVLGPRRAVLAGGILIAAGHFTLAIPTTAAFYLGLTLIVLGTGLLKPNISVMVGELYAPDDARRDAALAILRQEPRIEVLDQQGAFYLFLRAPAAPGGISGGDAFCARLLDEAGLAIVPGSAFRTPEWVRVSYAADQSDVERAMHMLVKTYRAVLEGTG